MRSAKIKAIENIKEFADQLKQTDKQFLEACKRRLSFENHQENYTTLTLSHPTWELMPFITNYAKILHGHIKKNL